MGLTILHSADWHLDSPFTGFSQDRRAFLKQEQRRLPAMIADLCQKEGCGLVLLAGDLFDGPADPETVELVKRALERCAVPVFIAPGNHDFLAPGSPWLEERWPENVHIFKGGLESVALPELDCRVWGAGFQSMDCLSVLEGFRAQGTERYQLAVLHGDPIQVKSPYNPVTAAQVRASGLDYLALGHVHKAGAFRCGKTLCAWPGCPMGRGWDETGERGVCVVDLDQSAELRPVALPTVRFHQLEVDTGSDAAAALEEALPAAGSTDFYRICLTGSAPVDVEALAERFTAFPNLELLDHTEPPRDLWADAGEDTLEGVYFRMLKQALEESPENAPVVRRAAEISRRLLDGKEVTL